MNEQNSLRLLLIDDELTVLTSVHLLLTRLGYKHVRTAACAQDARALLMSYRFDIIIADISLPDGDGRQLVRDALAHNPAARAILISGFMYRGLMIPHDLYGKVELLAKPFTEEELSGLLMVNSSVAH